MPEFEEAKPVNTKTDYELNSDKFSASNESQKQHIPTPPANKSFNRPSPERRSRYHSERRPGGPRPNPTPKPETPTPAPSVAQNENRDTDRPQRERREDSRPANRQERGPRPPRNNRNQRGPRPERKEGEESPDQNPNRNRNQNRNENRNRNRNRNRNNDRERAPRDDNRTETAEPSDPQNAPAKKTLFGSIMTSLKSMVGIKEEKPEPKKEFKERPDRPDRPHNRGPRRRRNPNQGNRPQGQSTHRRGSRDGDSSDPQNRDNDGPKKFANKRPRRRRRRPNPENNQGENAPKPDSNNPPSES